MTGPLRHLAHRSFSDFDARDWDIEEDDFGQYDDTEMLLDDDDLDLLLDDGAEDDFDTLLSDDFDDFDGDIIQRQHGRRRISDVNDLN